MRRFGATTSWVNFEIGACPRFCVNGLMARTITALRQTQLEFPFEDLLAHRFGL